MHSRVSLHVHTPTPPLPSPCPPAAVLSHVSGTQRYVDKMDQVVQMLSNREVPQHIKKRIMTYFEHKYR